MKIFKTKSCTINSSFIPRCRLCRVSLVEQDIIFFLYIFRGVKKGEIKLFILSKISTVKTQLISGTEFTSQSSPELSESKNSAQIYFFSSDPLITETQFKDPKSDFRTQNFAVMNDGVAGL